MPNERPTADQLILAKEPENQLILKNMTVSQGTALENSDKQFGTLNKEKSMVHSVLASDKDGTNSGVFFALEFVTRYCVRQSTVELLIGTEFFRLVKT